MAPPGPLQAGAAAPIDLKIDGSEAPYILPYHSHHTPHNIHPTHQARMAALGPTLNSTPLHGSEPPILERWERLEEGRYVGKLQGRTVWLDVSLEVRNAQSTHGLGV